MSQASTDQSAVDVNIPYLLAQFAITTIQLLGVIVVMSLMAWQVFVIFIPITAISLWYQVLLSTLDKLYHICPVSDLAFGIIVMNFSWFYILFSVILVQQYYLPSARELSRLIGVSKAPVIQHFAETISGAVTIRSFDQQSRFCQTSLKLINSYSQPAFYTAATMQWLSVRLDLLSLTTFICLLIFLVSVPVGLIDPGM